MMNDDVTELQTRLAFHEDAINQLSATVARQQNEIDILKQAMQSQNQRIQALTPADARDDGDEIPPHY